MAMFPFLKMSIMCITRFFAIVKGLNRVGPSFVISTLSLLVLLVLFLPIIISVILNAIIFFTWLRLFHGTAILLLGCLSPTNEVLL